MFDSFHQTNLEVEVQFIKSAVITKIGLLCLNRSRLVLVGLGKGGAKKCVTYLWRSEICESFVTEKGG